LIILCFQSRYNANIYIKSGNLILGSCYDFLWFGYEELTNQPTNQPAN